MSNMLRSVPTQFEPTRSNRFILEFPSELNFEEWLVDSVGRPKMSVIAVAIPYMNTEYYVAGRFKAEPFDIEFIEPIGPSTGQKVMEWFRRCAEFYSGRMGYAATYKKTLYLYALDPTGARVSKWEMVGCFITSNDGGSFDHKDDALTKIKITVQPDYVEQLY